MITAIPAWSSDQAGSITLTVEAGETVTYFAEEGVDVRDAGEIGYSPHPARRFFYIPLNQ